ncbi:hydrogenase nickel incorporation protein HypB, partial [Cronobacter malonaticus]|uniref:hydrogenase nickel incorporation protein HypB n=1 Tax=Cronobacter malonaticus TaxID=413503 RepID=UPI00325BD868
RHFGTLAEIKSRRADKIADVFNKQHAVIGKRQARHRFLDHLRVEMTPFAGINLNRRGAGSANALGVVALNLVSSPGSGKTTLLTETLKRLRDTTPCAVIEGDQQTVNDAERIRATGTPAIQVNTGKGCHLDAQMVEEAMARLPLADNGVLFIENVGNLVCPAGFDLGERHKVAVLSVTEGEDKPLKYPHMFAAASLMLLNKIDLLPYLNFDVEKCMAYAREVNPNITILLVSATRGDGMGAWLAWLEEQRCA